MHSLDYVPTIVEHSLDVFRVYGAREVRVAVVLAVPTRRAYALEIPFQLDSLIRFFYIIDSCGMSF